MKVWAFNDSPRKAWNTAALLKSAVIGTEAQGASAEPVYLGAETGETRTVCSYGTCQFDDYSKYEASRFDPVAKLKRRRKVFPQDQCKAFELGAWLAGG